MSGLPAIPKSFQCGEVLSYDPGALIPSVYHMSHQGISPCHSVIAPCTGFIPQMIIFLMRELVRFVPVNTVFQAKTAALQQLLKRLFCLLCMNNGRLDFLQLLLCQELPAFRSGSFRWEACHEPMHLGDGEASLLCHSQHAQKFKYA